MAATMPRPPISSTLGGCRIARRSSLSIGTATNSLMRFARATYASRNARCCAASVFCTAAGSGTPQWAVTGIAGPGRAHFARGLVANREHEVHHRGAGPGEFIPAFAAQTLRSEMKLLKRVTFGKAAGAVTLQ